MGRRGGGEGVGVLPPPFKWFVTVYMEGEEVIGGGHTSKEPNNT